MFFKYSLAWLFYWEDLEVLRRLLYKIFQSVENIMALYISAIILVRNLDINGIRPSLAYQNVDQDRNMDSAKDVGRDGGRIAGRVPNQRGGFIFAQRATHSGVPQLGPDGTPECFA